jgi:hypothetical protein
MRSVTSRLSSQRHDVVADRNAVVLRTHAEMASIVAQLEALVARRNASSTPRHSGRRLGTLLTTRGYLVQSELDFALARQAATGERLGEIVVQLGLVAEHVVVELIAEQLRIDVLDISKVRIDVEAARRLAEPDARRLSAIPIREDADASLVVAVADPARPHLVTDLTHLLHVPIHVLATTRGTVDELIRRAYVVEES